MKRRIPPSTQALSLTALLLAAGCTGGGSPDPTSADPDTSAGPGTSPGPETSDDATSSPSPGSSTDGDDTITGDDTTSGGPLPGTVLASECEPGAAETLVQTLQVQADGTEITSMPLTAGSIYRVEVLGTYVWGGCDPGGCPGGAACAYQRFGDAEVQSDDCWDTAFHGRGWSVITLHVDDQDLDWRRYGTDLHHYARVHDGDGSPLRFRIHDYCEGCYLDNSGQLEVRIWELPDDPRVWPNAMSCANSDEWLVDNHELVETMRPRVLALNYDNMRDNAAMLGLASDAIAAMRDGSRYHGWDPASTALPALEYEVALDVDLRDGAATANGATYPHEDPAEGGSALDYGAFFSEAYAENYGVLDPDDDTRYLTLCEMVDRGMVHEVWIHAFPEGHDNCGDLAAGEPLCGLEVVEAKPRYDDARVRIDVDGDGAFTKQDLGRCAGNGCLDEEDLEAMPDDCTRSLRIAYIDSTRGPLCLTHSLSHGMEGTGTARYDGGNSYVPYFQQYFRELAGFEITADYGVPLESWYGLCNNDGCQGTLSYPTDTSVTYTEVNPMTGATIQTGTVMDYDPVCGNVHFPPNARHDYDWQGPDPIQTTCTSYRMGNGPDGTDLAASYDTSVLTGLGYDTTYDQDCGGPWDVWWRQNMPGHQNLAWDAEGYRMLSWWPFLFY